MSKNNELPVSSDTNADQQASEQEAQKQKKSQDHRTRPEALVGALLSEVSYVGKSRAFGSNGIPEDMLLDDRKAEQFRQKLAKGELWDMKEASEMRNAFWRDELMMLTLDEISAQKDLAERREELARRMWVSLFTRPYHPAGVEKTLKVEADHNNASANREWDVRQGYRRGHKSDVAFTRPGVFRATDVHCVLYAQVWDPQTHFTAENKTIWVSARGTENNARALESPIKTFFVDYAFKAYRNFAKTYKSRYKDSLDAVLKSSDKMPEEQRPNKIILCGHSLGGSEAIEALIQGQGDFKERNMTTEGYTYGSPGTGSVGVLSAAAGIPFAAVVGLMHVSRLVWEMIPGMAPQVGRLSKQASGLQGFGRLVRVKAASLVNQISRLPIINLANRFSQIGANVLDAFSEWDITAPRRSINAGMLGLGWKGWREPGAEKAAHVEGNMVHYAHRRDFIRLVGECASFLLPGKRVLIDTQQAAGSPVREHSSTMYVSSIQDLLTREDQTDHPWMKSLAGCRAVVDMMLQKQALLHKEAIRQGVEEAFIQRQLVSTPSFDQNETPLWVRRQLAAEKKLFNNAASDEMGVTFSEFEANRLVNAEELKKRADKTKLEQELAEIKDQGNKSSITVSLSTLGKVSNWFKNLTDVNVSAGMRGLEAGDPKGKSVYVATQLAAQSVVGGAGQVSHPALQSSMLSLNTINGLHLGDKNPLVNKMSFNEVAQTFGLDSVGLSPTPLSKAGVTEFTAPISSSVQLSLMSNAVTQTTSVGSITVGNTRIGSVINPVSPAANNAFHIDNGVLGFSTQTAMEGINLTGNARLTFHDAGKRAKASGSRGIEKDPAPVAQTDYSEKDEARAGLVSKSVSVSNRMGRPVRSVVGPHSDLGQVGFNTGNTPQFSWTLFDPSKDKLATFREQKEGSSKVNTQIIVFEADEPIEKISKKIKNSTEVTQPIRPINKELRKALNEVNPSFKVTDEIDAKVIEEVAATLKQERQLSDAMGASDNPLQDKLKEQQAKQQIKKNKKLRIFGVNSLNLKQSKKQMEMIMAIREYEKSFLNDMGAQAAKSLAKGQSRISLAIDNTQSSTKGRVLISEELLGEMGGFVEIRRPENQVEKWEASPGSFAKRLSEARTQRDKNKAEVIIEHVASLWGTRL